MQGKARDTSILTKLIRQYHDESSGTKGKTMVLGENIEMEIRDWYNPYTEAWDNGGADTIAALTDPALHSTMVMMDGQEHRQVSYAGNIEGTRGFFKYLETHGSRNEFKIDGIAFRSPDEAIVATRKTVTIIGGENPRTTT
jgi:hypothetical protein